MLLIDPESARTCGFVNLLIPIVETRNNSAKDHVLLGPAYAVNLETHSQLTASPAFLEEAIFQYNSQRQGILTNPGSDFVGELMQRS